MLYCWSLNNFESSLILQFFKCYETKPLQVWSLPPCKTAFLSKHFVLQVITVFRSSHQTCTVKKCYWKFEKFHMKTPVLESLFNKAAGPKACNFNEKDSNTDVSCEIFKNFKNNNFKHLRTTVFVRLRKISPLFV